MTALTMLWRSRWPNTRTAAEPCRVLYPRAPNKSHAPLFEGSGFRVSGFRGSLNHMRESLGSLKKPLMPETWDVPPSTSRP